MSLPWNSLAFTFAKRKRKQGNHFDIRGTITGDDECVPANVTYGQTVHTDSDTKV